MAYSTFNGLFSFNFYIFLKKKCFFRRIIRVLYLANELISQFEIMRNRFSAFLGQN